MHTKKGVAIAAPFRDPCRIQTCNPHIRSVVLYSVELMDHCFKKKRACALGGADETRTREKVESHY